jgi:hypothetical protein
MYIVISLNQVTRLNNLVHMCILIAILGNAIHENLSQSSTEKYITSNKQRPSQVLGFNNNNCVNKYSGINTYEPSCNIYIFTTQVAGNV